MSDDLDDFGDECLIWRDLVVPILHEVPDDDCDDGVELQVDIVPAS